jgi:RiboL-PSP-HEPN
MAAAVDTVLRSFERDIIRNNIFLVLERKIKNPAGNRSRGRSETLLSAYVSLTCGRFEKYLQDVFFASADDLKKRIVKSNDPRIIKREKFHWTNINSFIVWVAGHGRRLSKSQLEVEIQAYVTAVAAGEIFPDSFKYTNANPKSDTLREMFARFGVEDSFSKLAANYLDSRGRKLGKALLETTLDNFVSRRHEAAHHGRIPNVTRVDAADDDVFIRAFAAAIAKVLKNHIAAIV